MVGYHNYSKSNNAVIAESEEKFPASVLGNILNVETNAIKELMRPCEWHHTSSHFNKTDYYDLNEAKDIIDKLKKWENKNKPWKKSSCTVKWFEWSGTLKRPICTKRTEKNCAVEYNGKSTYTIILSDGLHFIKRKGTKGFEIIPGNTE